MIDWHSHILPAIDDGSRSAEESIEMLKMLGAQGVGEVMATPHFFADREELDGFLKRREESYGRLLFELPSGLPRIRLGAEVSYYGGISRMEGLERLCLEGTSILLLEMPMSEWTELTVRELTELSGSGQIKVALAHVERYFPYQARETVNRLYESGIIMQVNSSFFCEFKARRRALSMLSGGEIHLIGSDCHSLAHRPPRIGRAFEIIEKKLGSEFLCGFNEFGKSLLCRD